MKKFITILLVGIVSTACAGIHETSNKILPQSESEPPVKVITISEVKWEQLNPARGTKSPMAGVLWGNRIGTGPAGFLLKPVNGFRSPPHIHNISYRGVVISGSIHNDHPDSSDIYMPVGSYWTQPEGGVHITAAKGDTILAYIEVEDRFRVLPADQAFDAEDDAMNMNASDIVWGNPPGNIDSDNGPQVVTLWGNPQDSEPSGTLVKLQAGSSGTIRSYGSELHAVIILGQTNHSIPGESMINALKPGSYFGSKGESAHQVSCEDGDDCIIYVRTDGEFEILPAELNN